MNLAQLRKALKQKQDALPALETKATADAATDEDVAALDTSLNEIEKLEKRIGTVERSEKTRAAAAKAVNDDVSDEEDEDEDEDDEPVVVKSGRPDKADLTPTSILKFVIGGTVKNYAIDGRVSDRGVLKAMQDGGLAGIAKHLDNLAKKNVNTTSAAAGGFTVPTVLSPELIPLLYRKATFKQSGPRLIPMPDGNFKKAGLATGATAGYRAEAAEPMISHATFREIDMKAKLLAGMTSVTDQMMRWSVAQIGNELINDLQRATSLVYDQACYMGAGGPNVPLGIFNIVGIPSVAHGLTSSTAPTVYDIDQMCRRMEAAQDNVQLNSAESGWAMAYRTKQYLTDLRLPQSDELAFPTLSGPNPMLRDRKVTVSFNIPSNLGAGTNESFLGLVHWPTVLDGESLGMKMKMSDTASTATLNAFSEGLTLFRVEMEHDLEIEYTQSVVRSTNFQIGA